MLAIKLLTEQLKELDTIINELRAEINRNSNEMNSYKKTLAFRLNLAQACTQKLIHNHPMDIQELINLH